MNKTVSFIAVSLLGCFVPVLTLGQTISADLFKTEELVSLSSLPAFLPDEFALYPLETVPRSVEQAVQAAIDGLQTAIKTKDKALYDRYVAPEYIHTNPAGEVTNREQEFSDMTSGVQTFASIKVIPLPYDRIRIFNENTAVVTTHFNVTGNDHGQDFTMQTRSLATWVNQNGAWQMVAFQATGVAKKFQK